MAKRNGSTPPTCNAYERMDADIRPWPTVLSEDFTAERTRLLDTLDAQECGRCQTPVPYGAVEDAEWFIDSFVDQPDGFAIEVAVIRCPLCW